MLINILLIMLMMFSSIAFFTIMERKLLGIFHMRLGPNKVGILGLFQPFSDALKLFSKKFLILSKVNINFWNSSPLLVFLMFMFMMNFIPIKSENNNMMINLMFFVFMISLFIFPIFWGSYFSFSKFSIISSKRLMAQMISYEMGLMMILIFLIPLIMKSNLSTVLIFLKDLSMMKISILMMMFILVLSESSRIPFDFIEGESELVSGFNTEFFSSYFSLFFIYEYGMMLLFSMIISFMENFILSMILMYLFILIRASFPRMRYDNMMILMWKMIYPLLICLLISIKFI